jgi:hypothetical protein
VNCLSENKPNFVDFSLLCGVGICYCFVFFYSDDPPISPAGGMDINTALQEVLKMALTHGSLAHGLHEAAKALDKYVKPKRMIMK